MGRPKHYPQRAKIQDTPETRAFCATHTLDECAEHWKVARETARRRLRELDIEWLVPPGKTLNRAALHFKTEQEMLAAMVTMEIDAFAKLVGLQTGAVQRLERRHDVYCMRKCWVCEGVSPYVEMQKRADGMRLRRHIECKPARPSAPKVVPQGPKVNWLTVPMSDHIEVNGYLRGQNWGMGMWMMGE